jgi:hypothetical protein
MQISLMRFDRRLFPESRDGLAAPAISAAVRLSRNLRFACAVAAPSAIHQARHKHGFRRSHQASPMVTPEVQQRSRDTHDRQGHQGPSKSESRLVHALSPSDRLLSSYRVPGPPVVSLNSFVTSFRKGERVPRAGARVAHASIPDQANASHFDTPGPNRPVRCPKT